MYPYLELGPLTVSVYSIMVLLGGAASVCLALCLFSRTQLDKNQILYTYTFGGIGAFFGAHILFALTMIPQIIVFFKNISHFTENLPSVNGFIELGNALGALVGGMVFYGGLIGGLIGGALSMKSCKVDVLHYADAFAPTIPLFHFFGRIGCFFSGCCYGIESRFGIVLHDTIEPALDGVRRFPVQLLEAAFNLLLCGVLTALYFLLRCGKTKQADGRKIPKGGLLAMYLLVYGIARFGFEFLRGDLIRGVWLGLSTSQWISLVLVVLSAAFLLIQYMKRSGISSKPAEPRTV